MLVYLDVNAGAALQPYSVGNRTAYSPGPNRVVWTKRKLMVFFIDALNSHYFLLVMHPHVVTQNIMTGKDGAAYL